jgi:hypothetical protein
MKSMLMPAALALALAAWLTPAPVQAAGRLKGAAIGGVAGHFARVTTVCWGLAQAASLGATRQTSARVNAPSRTGHLTTSSEPGYAGSAASFRLLKHQSASKEMSRCPKAPPEAFQ